MTDRALLRAFVRWQWAAGPLAPFVNVAPFLAASRRVVRPRSDDALVERIVSLVPAGPHLLVLDLPCERGIWVVAALHRHHGYAVAPVIVRWPAEQGLLDGSRLAGALTAAATELRRLAGPGRLAVLLDGDRGVYEARSGRSREQALIRRFDNRYEYSSHLLPRADFLVSLGVKQVLLAGPFLPAPDVRQLLESAAAGGLKTSVLNLAVGA